MLNMKNMKSELEHNIVGVTTVGERGQIVIPKSIRDQLEIKKGCQFIMLLNNGGLALITLDSLKKLTDSLTKEIQNFNTKLKK